MTRVDEALRRLKEGKGVTATTTIEHEVVPFAANTDFWPSEQPAAQSSVRTTAVVEEPPARSQPDARVDPPAPAAEPQQVSSPVDTPPAVPESIQEKVVTTAVDASVSIEQYRRLAARLHLAQAERGIRSVMVASAAPGEGKTLTATNLALTLSDSYQREVLLVDGDLRRPSLHDMFGLPNVAGLNDGIKDHVDSQVPLTHVSKCLTLLTAGRPDPDPMSVLSSQRMQQVITEAKLLVDWVIVDTPPVGLLTDAKLLAAFVDVVIFVIRAGETPAEVIQHALNAIGREKIFGIVLNEVRVTPRSEYEYVPVRG